MAQTNPAPVSGPGPFAKRTDLAGQGKKDLPNAGYGEQKDFQEIQGGAPMAKAQRSVTPLSAPTRFPDRPVTYGLDKGPGAGSEILQTKGKAATAAEDMTALARFMPLMQIYADSPASSGTMRAFMRYLRSQA